MGAISRQHRHHHQQIESMKKLPTGIKVEVNQVSACPPLLGDPTPPGCDKTFVKDSGDISCWDDTDCPEPGTCQNNLCNFWVNDYDCDSCFAGGDIISFTSPISGQSTVTNSCIHCSKTTCPPARPCRRGGRCSTPRCNR